MEEIKSYPVKLFKTFVWRRMRFEWRWNVKATNGRMIGSSGSESYVNKADAEYNIKSLGKSLSEY